MFPDFPNALPRSLATLLFACIGTVTMLSIITIPGA